MTKRRILPAEFREQMIKLVRAGRAPEELSREFEPLPQTIRNWVARAYIDNGRREGLSTAERDALRMLRRENKRLRQEREILAKAAAWFVQGTWLAPSQLVQPLC